jgi:hypothetical protein
MSHHVCRNFKIILYVKEKKRNDYLIASIFSSDNLKDRLETIEEDYQLSIELEKPIKTTSSIIFQKGLFYFCRKGFGNFYFA